MDMTESSIIRLSKSVSDEALVQQARSMRKLRLLSLQTEPRVFISRYEDEVDQPLQFSIDRLKNPAAEHFVAEIDPQSRHGASTAPPQYCAFLVIIKMDSKAAADAKEYSMAAVYVRPDHRRKGVCSQMIRAALQWIVEDLRHTKYEKAVVSISSAKVNISAQRLYAKLGFMEVSHTSEKNKIGVEVPVVNMELRISR